MEHEGEMRCAKIGQGKECTGCQDDPILEEFRSVRGIERQDQGRYRGSGERIGKIQILSLNLTIDSHSTTAAG